ncbi:MAG: BPSS1780 family membrane protein [Rhodocyclaceae bacterium]|nr:BPSS1780 family membrane protein [Rhodocyclaceae bacterium]
MQARRLPASRGAFWLLAGFHLFRRNPPLLTALTLTYLLLVQIAVRLLPEVGPFLLPLALPAMVLIVANGARIASQGNRLLPGALVFGLKGNGAAMLRLGGLHLVGAMIFVGIILLLEGGGIKFADIEKGEDPELVWALLRLFVLAIPFLLAFLFAPYLTGWDGVPAAQSLFFSFVASIRNWRVLLTYLLAVGGVSVVLPGLVLVVASLLPEFGARVVQVVIRMLMIFLLAPVLTASIYIAYRDIFHPPMDEHA